MGFFNQKIPDFQGAKFEGAITRQGPLNRGFNVFKFSYECKVLLSIFFPWKASVVLKIFMKIKLIFNFARSLFLVSPLLFRTLGELINSISGPHWNMDRNGRRHAIPYYIHTTDINVNNMTQKLYFIIQLWTFIRLEGKNKWYSCVLEVKNSYFQFLYVDITVLCFVM